LLCRTADLIDSGTVEPKDQRGEATPAPKILPEHRLIKWEKGATAIRNLIRGLSPRPGAYTLLEGERLKVFRAMLLKDPAEETYSPRPGTVTACGREGLVIQTGEGRLSLVDVQLENKERMGIGQFVCGRDVKKGILLGGLHSPSAD
jgi:methionyl-tRNA formyltransferase